MGALVCNIAVKQQILRFQSPTTGLFPSDLGQSHSVEAHVRDSVYCAAAVWAVAQAYKYVAWLFTIGIHGNLTKCVLRCEGVFSYRWL